MKKIEIRKIVAVYPILVGVSMMGMWGILLGSGQVPEIKTEPVYLLVHLIAEFLTATTLILGGMGLLKNCKWGLKMYLVSMGMLLYSILTALGYYAQKNEPEMIVMFACLTIFTALLITSSIITNSGNVLHHNPKEQSGG